MSPAWLLAFGLIYQATSVTFPLYKQCDPKWGQNEMGVPGHEAEDDTVCHQGCAMSCVSMALAGYNITINGTFFFLRDLRTIVGFRGLTRVGQTATPGTLNDWLRQNDGYLCASGDCCNLVLDAPARLSPRVKSLGEPNVPPLETLVKWVKQGK